MRCYITEVVRRAPKETDARPTRHKCGCASLDRSECFALLCFARCFASRVALPARTSARLPALAAWPHKSLPQAIGACAVQYGAEASRRGGAVDNEHKQGCNARREWPPPCRHARAWHSEGAVQTDLHRPGHVEHKHRLPVAVPLERVERREVRRRSIRAVERPLARRKPAVAAPTRTARCINRVPT